MDTVFIVLFVLLLVLLIAREFWCWYWKINQIVHHLSEINGKLDVLIGVTDESNRLLGQATSIETD